jgi:hypothetical protein
MARNETFEEAVLLATVEEQSRAYEALSQITALDASSHVSLREAAVFARDGTVTRYSRAAVEADTRSASRT